MTDDNDGDIDTDVTVGVLSTLKQNERKKTSFGMGGVFYRFFLKYCNLAVLSFPVGDNWNIQASGHFGSTVIHQFT